MRTNQDEKLGETIFESPENTMLEEEYSVIVAARSKNEFY